MTCCGGRAIHEPDERGRYPGYDDARMPPYTRGLHEIGATLTCNPTAAGNGATRASCSATETRTGEDPYAVCSEGTSLSEMRTQVGLDPFPGDSHDAVVWGWRTSRGERESTLVRNLRKYIILLIFN